MREAVATALNLAEGQGREDLESNVMLAMALTRCLEILGEAASKLGEEVRRRNPDIPYVQMVAMRNRLIHAYFDVNLDIVWTTVSEDLPPLLAVLDHALTEFED